MPTALCYRVWGVPLRKKHSAV